MFTTKKILESGSQFGHPKSKWNPKMAEYIHTVKDDTHILDVKKSIRLGNELLVVMANVAKEGEILFIGTKKQATDSVKAAAESCEMPYVNHRWLGGTLTNFKTIKDRIKYLDTLDSLFETGEIEKYPKKEIVEMSKTREKLNKFIGGIRNMKKIPIAIFVIDAQSDEIAIKEARVLGIKVYGICDTNINPELFDKFIPANDDAIKSISMISNIIAESINAGKNGQSFNIDELMENSEKQDVIDKAEREKMLAARTKRSL